MNLGVCIWLYNDENLIHDCVKSVLQVFDNAEVYDIGSSDSSIERVKSLGAKINLLGKDGKLNGPTYTKKKQEILSKFDYVFNIDGDEIYPKHTLLGIRDKIKEKPPTIISFWKMLKFIGDDLFISSPHQIGEIGWNTKKFILRRGWPNESLFPLEGKNLPRGTVCDTFYCWHGVLLNRSRAFHSTREHKKTKRMIQFKDLEWKKIDYLPWNPSDPHLIERLK